jgi:hypothetical protein
VLLTSTVAQCSRLVASRNDLRTGGQAWTVPGFWVPPVHLETKSLVQIRRGSRRSFAVSGTCDRWPTEGRARSLRPHRTCSDCSRVGARRWCFLDPPYGDSVPYVEFSTMWNAFLGEVRIRTRTSR